jgi:hypothetical protein
MRYLLLSVLVVSLVGVALMPIALAAITYDDWACCPKRPNAELVFNNWQFIEKENYNQIKVHLTVHTLEEITVNNESKFNSDFKLLNKDGKYYHDNSYNSARFWYKEPGPKDMTLIFDVDKKYGKSDKFSIYMEDFIKAQPQCDAPRGMGAFGERYCKILELSDLTYSSSMGGGGCLIATAAFGSEMAPQVQFLREFRDNTVLQTESGSTFMTGFNQFYYSFSPAVADYERENPAFKEAVKITLTPLLTSLTLLQYADIDSESEMLGYGIGVILLNIGMYFVAPAVLIMTVRKRI